MVWPKSCIVVVLPAGRLAHAAFAAHKDPLQRVLLHKILQAGLQRLQIVDHNANLSETRRNRKLSKINCNEYEFWRGV